MINAGPVAIPCPMDECDHVLTGTVLLVPDPRDAYLILDEEAFRGVLREHFGDSHSDLIAGAPARVMDAGRRERQGGRLR